MDFRPAPRILIWRALARSRYSAVIAEVRRTWRLLERSLAGAALVLAYLVGHQWLAANDVELGFENRRLQDDLAEIAAARTQKLIYMIEAGSTAEAKDKLSRLAVMVAAEQYNLQRAEERR